jgi:ABC-2 type transport system permease protein
MAAWAARVKQGLGGERWDHFLTLTTALAGVEFKLRYFGSVLGYLWTFLRPLMLFGVLYVVFTEIAGVGDDIKDYGICILFSMVLFQFFAESTSGSVTSVIRRENLLRKMRFPRLAIPLSTVLTALMNFGATLVAVIVFAVATGVYPTWGWLELPLLVALVAVFGTGTGMLLSVLFVRYRDIEPIWDVAIQMLFYASPILYVTTMVPEDYQRLYLFNPLAAILTQVRHAVVDPSAPSAAELIGGAGWLLVPAAVTVVVCALGVWAFRREAPRIAEHL